MTVMIIKLTGLTFGGYKLETNKNGGCKLTDESN